LIEKNGEHGSKLILRQKMKFGWSIRLRRQVINESYTMMRLKKLFVLDGLIVLLNHLTKIPLFKDFVREEKTPHSHNQTLND